MTLALTFRSILTFVVCQDLSSLWTISLISTPSQKLDVDVIRALSMFVEEANCKMSDIGINFVPLISDIEQRFGYYLKSYIELSNQTVITFFDIRFCDCHILYTHSAYPDLGGLAWPGYCSASPVHD